MFTKPKRQTEAPSGYRLKTTLQSKTTPSSGVVSRHMYRIDVHIYYILIHNNTKG